MGLHKGQMTEEHKNKLRKLNQLRIGASNPNWKGGIKSLNPKEYQRKKGREYWKKNKGKRNVYDRRKHKKNRHKLERKAEGYYTLGEFELLKKQYNFTCPCCKKSEPEIKLTVDHIIPLSRGGSNWIENIQPLCLPCNQQKYTKIIKFELESSAR